MEARNRAAESKKVNYLKQLFKNDTVIKTEFASKAATAAAKLEAKMKVAESKEVKFLKQLFQI